ncbi:MAG: aminomethyl-transferring glycine dehydrogenase subunit GcvPA [Muribaculaceae bacterium]|nr:aminomethyl-transferring glycine dehydrogenase subunit GcvPA [Muribaculaceae bacterium]
MSHRYLPHTQADIDRMLRRCGVSRIEDLYSDVPEQLLFKGEYDIPSEMSERQVREFFNTLGDANRQLVCFAGNGFYDHDTPAAVSYVISRSEFLTAYTPYQPEISQGTLQYIFEYQTMMCRLTGMDVSNASMYDGTTATAEAMMMSVAHARKRNRVLVSATMRQGVTDVVATYARYHGVTVDIIPEKDGVTDADALAGMLAEGNVAGVIVAQRNRYGIIEDYTGFSEKCKGAKALFIMNCVASDLAVLKTPAEWGADVAVGDAQSLGIPLSYGGPYLGFMCCTNALIRKLPGRIVGKTVDNDGRRVFVLTLQAREQHIRREKATSNICSNQGLMALFVTVYMSLAGAEGLREINRQGEKGAHYLARQLTSTGKTTLTFPDKPFLNEFCITTTAPASEIITKALEQGILAGVALDEHRMTIAVTELQSKEDMDRLTEIVKAL